MSEPVKYHIPESCNRCSGSSELIDPYYHEGTLHESKTKCKKCGFEDHWTYGFFESSTQMVSNCKTYSFIKYGEQ